MSFRFALIIVIAFIAIGFNSPAISADTQSDIENPDFFGPFPLHEQFDRVHLLPGKGQALIISRETGRCILIDFDRNIPETIFEFGHPVDNIVVSEDGRFAYFAGTDVNIFAPLLWRGDITNGSLRRITLPLDIREPQLALGVENHLVIADRKTNTLAIMNTGIFDDKALSTSRFPGKRIELDDTTSAIAGHPEEDLVILFREADSTVSGFSIKEMVPYSLTSIPLSRETYHPPALALAKGGDRTDRNAEPMVVIGDPVGSRIMIFDYNRSFQALDFVTEAPIIIRDSNHKSKADQKETALVIAASDGLSAILVAPRRGKRVYFFSRKGNVLKRLNRWENSEVVDLDVSANGNLAVILADGGTSLVWVERPDALAPIERTGGSRKTLQVQQKLSALGFMVGAADGILGKNTQRAIILFQRSQGLNQTGELDEKTLFRLDSEFNKMLYSEGSAFEERFNSEEIQGFQANEFLVFGQEETCKEMNRFPPKRTWCNAIRIAKIMADFRKRWGHPVDIKAAYRSPEYSVCVGEEKDSPYTEFMAVDFSSHNGTPAEWASLLETMRSEGRFEGEVKARDKLVHLELHQTPDLWVLVGTRTSKGDFESRYFDIAEPPVQGVSQLLNSKVPVLLRVSAPYKKDGRWVLTEWVSSLPEPLVLHVDRVIELDYPAGETHYWAGGRVIFEDSAVESAKNHNWSVVINYDTSEEWIRSEARKLKKAHSDFSFELYKTIIWYVIVSGTNLSQADAKKRVLDLKCTGISDNPSRFPFMWLQKDLIKLK